MISPLGYIRFAGAIHISFFLVCPLATSKAPYAQLVPALGQAPDYIGALYGGA